MHARWLAALAICTGCGFSIPAAGDDQGPDGHGADDTPWLAGWSYRRPITLKSSLLNEDLVDFPVMIPLANEQLGDHTLADRADLAFTTDDGTTRLDREIESKLENDTTVWVKVSLSAMANTTIYVYYGNPVPPTLPPDQVWTASFHAVYHLQQDPSTGRADDSTVHAHHGTPEMLAAADGQIGRAIHFNDRKSHVSISDFGIGEKFTISMWMNMNNDSGMQTLFANSSRTFDADTKGFRMYLGENRTLIFETGNGNRNQSKSVTSTNAITTGAWHHVAALVDRAAGMAEIFVDGVGASGDILNDFQIIQDFEIGRMKNSDNTFHGVIDEVEIASTVRSPAWMNASYQSQNKPLDYIDLGDEQLLPAPPPQ